MLLAIGRHRWQTHATDGTSTTEAPIGGDALARPQADRSARGALLVFAALLVVALPLLLALGGYRWFFHDEWDYLAGRNGGDIENILIPHNEHWSTLPILVYRALFRLVGLRSYLPYQAVLVVLHLTAAALLRVVMRRAGVGPWIATAAAALFVLFGTGAENLVYAVNMGFAGALVFGLVQLLLADHDGPIDRRDAIGLLAGFLALLCSSVALTMVAVVGVATLVRRGWRVAALHTAPLAVIYVAWFLAFRDKRTAHGVGWFRHEVSSPREVVRFVRTGVAAAFNGMGQLRAVALALGVILVVGLALAWRSRDLAQRRRLAAPAALLVGAFLSLGLTGIARAADFGPEFARRGRYLYLFAALVLPALAVAADAVTRRWRVLAPVVLVILLAGIPGNVDALLQQREPGASVQAGYRKLVLTLPRVPVAHQVARSTRPEQGFAKRLTVGWLLDGVASGRIPKPAITPVDAATATLYVALSQQPNVFFPSACQDTTTPLELRLPASQVIRIKGVVRVVYVTPTGVRSRPVTFDPSNSILTAKGTAPRGPRLVALAGPLTLEVDSTDRQKPAAVCIPDGTLISSPASSSG